jgi:hypothetical protein
MRYLAAILLGLILLGCSDRPTPKQIEAKVYADFGKENIGGLDCRDRAIAAKKLAEAFGYRAVYRSSKTHRWLAIYTDDGIVEILK